MTASELDQAETLANRLEIALGVKEQGPAGAPEASHTRNKAFHVFLKAYDAARRVVTFLRWNEGDVDSIAPSLYAGRFSRKTEVADETAAEAPAPAQPVATPVAAPGVADPNAAPGMPGSPPFIKN